MQAVILAGGLSRRLGGVPKAGLRVGGVTLLARTVEAALALIDGKGPGWDARPEVTLPRDAAPDVAVVGPAEVLAPWLGALAGRVVFARENPPYSGPAAGLAAGLAALAGALPGTPGALPGAPELAHRHVLVLACDMPRAGGLVHLLAGELEGAGPGTGVMAGDGGRRQPRAAIYPLGPLQAAVDAARASHRLSNASVFSLLASVNTKECAVPPGLTADIDTWDDARMHGIAAPDQDPAPAVTGGRDKKGWNHGKP
jgi:molybdopterin-guanine dinucleotide biosynthesis protein A